MEEVLDIFLARFIFGLFICFIIYIYKYAHILFYPTGKRQVAKSFHVLSNSADTLHYLSRILGIVFILSQIQFDRFFSLSLNSLNILIISLSSIFFYLSSVWISDTVILGKYEYVDEILKKNNIAYALISLSKNVGIALIIQKIYLNSQNSIIIYLILWTFINFIFLVISKCYPFFSFFPFHKMVIKKNIGMALSYSGFITGNSLLFYYALNEPNIDVYSYLIRVSLKVFLCILFVPLFIWGIKILIPTKANQNQTDRTLYFDSERSLALGIYEGISYFSACILTSWIVYKINLSGVLTNY